MDADGEPLAFSIIHKWRTQKQKDKDLIELQERGFHVESHFKAMCEAGGVTDHNAEAF